MTPRRSLLSSGRRRPAQDGLASFIVGYVRKSEPETPRSPGCLAPEVWLCCGMKWRTRRSVTRRVSRLSRMLMLVLGVVSVPSIGPAAMQRPHCAQHVPSPGNHVAHSGDTHRAEPTLVAWESGTKHTCPHCPATECARIAPCTASSNAAISETSLIVPDPVSDRVGVRRVRVRPYSATHQPPTPPPQLTS
jgi:hypothetical protein